MSMPGTTGRGQRARGAFTLVELLVVIGIIAVLLVVAISSVSNIGRATQVELAAQQVKTTLHLARQWAVTQRRVTHVVFPISAANDRIMRGSILIAENVNYRSYGVYEATDTILGGNPVLDPVREWTFLPPGTWFDPGPFPNKNLLHSNQSSYRSANPGLWTNQPTFSFHPNGSLTSKSVAPEVFVAEGFRASGAAAAAAPTIQDRGLQTSVQVYQWTGMPQLNRYGEGP